MKVTLKTKTKNKKNENLICDYIYELTEPATPIRVIHLRKLENFFFSCDEQLLANYSGL